MAFGKINEIRENNGAFKKYVGVAPVQVVAINPTMKQLVDLGYKVTEEPKYVSTTDDGIPQIRIEFVVKTLPDKCNDIDQMFRFSFTLRKKAIIGSNTGKYKIMDIYGQTAWATKEEIDKNLIPQYATGPANITNKYRIICDGEEELTNFIRTYLNIPNVTKFINGQPAGMIDNPADAEGMLDNIKNYFTGDITELREIINMAPNNWIKILIGVKTTDENKQYQTVFTREFVPGGSNKFNRLSKILQENLAVGRYANVYFGPIVGDSVMINQLAEYTVAPTDILPNNIAIPTSGNNNVPSMPDDLPF